MPRRFVWVFFALLVFGLGGQPAQAGNTVIATVQVGGLRPDTAKMHGVVSWDPIFNAKVYALAGKVTSDSADSVKEYAVSGRIPEKYQVPVGTILDNFYVQYRGGNIAQLCRHWNRTDGRYQIQAGESRWVADYGGGMVLSIGTCANLMVWRRPEQPKPPCVELQIRKETEGSDKRDFDFRLEWRRDRDDRWDELETLTTNRNGEANKELKKPGLYRLTEIRLPERFEGVEPREGEYVFEVTAETRGPIVKHFRNRYTPEVVKQVCATLRIYKTTEGSSRLDGFRFRLELKGRDGDWREVAILVTDRDGNASRKVMEAGSYRLTEIDLPEHFSVIDPPSGQYEFAVDVDTTSVEKRYRNKYCLPPSFDSTVTPPPPPQRERPTYVPETKSTYITGRGHRETTEGSMGSVGLYSQQRQRVSKEKCCKTPPKTPPGRHIPPGKIPTDVGQPPGDPTSGKPPRGRVPTGY